MSRTVSDESTASEPRPKRSGVVGGLIRTARPRQWVKNVLVLAAPFVGNRISERAVLVEAAIAFVAFCLVASAVYLVNDAIDVEADRAHPTKRNRPIAAGIVPVPLAYAALGGAVPRLARARPWLAGRWRGHRRVRGRAAGLLPWLEAPAGDRPVHRRVRLPAALDRGRRRGAASRCPSGSCWCTAFGSLFMVSGKRYAEILLFENTGAKIRASLTKYSSSYLRFVWATSAAIMIMTYGLWAFEIREGTRSVWPVVSMVPFTVAVLRYAVDVDGGNAGEPEEIALRDRVLQILGASWIATLALSVYL